jgi:hypothetical protein
MLQRLLRSVLMAGGGLLGRALLGRQVFGRIVLDAAIRSYQIGDYDEAWRQLSLATRANPDDADAQYLSGMAALHRQGAAAARPYFEHAGELDPMNPRAHIALAEIDLPGPDYFEVLRHVHEHLRPRTYLEIGVETGMSLALALPETRAIGIDPTPRLAVPLGALTKVYETTSDEFFATQNVREKLGGSPIELAFIDGMHRFEFALRDFINVERNCTPQSTILFHDAYPLDRATASRDRRTNFWSGDTWRLVLALRKYRPGLRVYNVATAPTGLGIVRGLDPDSRVLSERFEDIVREFMALDYSVLDADKPGTLAAFPNDWERIKSVLQ